MEIIFLTLTIADFIRNRFDLNPARVAAVVMAIFGLLGGYLWNACAIYPGAGLPARNYAIPYVGSLAESAFLCGAVGFMLVSLMSPRTRSKIRTDRRFISKGLASFLPAVSIGLALLWLLGEGPNILARDVYLGANGAQWIQKLTSYICPFLAAGILFSVRRYGSTSSKLNDVVGIIWVLLLASTGTRVVELFILCLAFSFAPSKSGRPWLTLFQKLAQISLGFVCFIVAFRLSLFSRSHPHGLLRLVDNLFGRQGVAFIGFDEVRTTIGTLGSSIFEGYAVVEQTIRHAPPLSTILSNANPLPSFQQVSSSSQSERLWPYAWVPQGFWGQIFGAGGPLLTIVVCVLVGALANSFYSRARSRDHFIEANIILLLVILMTFVGTEYPSRNFFRLASFTVLVPMGVGLGRWIVSQYQNASKLEPSDVVPKRLH